ncbi:DUF5802 family protein [Haloferacaceae archaeon DSL9]
MFERFSSGYYLGKMYVEPHDGDTAVMQLTDHRTVNERFYASGEGVEPLDTPLVMKLDAAHFPVVGDDAVPTGTLGLPRELAPDDLPSTREVFLANADRAWELLRYSGWKAPSGT